MLTGRRYRNTLQVKLALWHQHRRHRRRRRWPRTGGCHQAGWWRGGVRAAAPTAWGWAARTPMCTRCAAAAPSRKSPTLPPPPSFAHAVRSPIPTPLSITAPPSQTAHRGLQSATANTLSCRLWEPQFLYPLISPPPLLSLSPLCMRVVVTYVQHAHA